MIVSTKRVVVRVFLALLVAVTGAAVAVAPASAAGYSPSATPSRISAHHGAVITVTVRNFPASAAGTITAQGHGKNQVLSRFATNYAGYRSDDHVTIARNLPNGYYFFVVRVKGKSAAFSFHVV